MRWLCALLLLLPGGCGYVGDPLPPALEVPVGITDLRAVQVGDRIVIELTAPAVTTEDLPVRNLGPVEVRIGPTLETGKSYQPAGSAQGSIKFEQPAREFTGKEVVIAARASSPRGRPSHWSNLVTLRVIEPLFPPGLQASPHPEGVRLAWKPEGRQGVKYSIFRSSATEPKAAQTTVVEVPEFVDATAQMGQTYEYSVQTSLDTALSEVSAKVAITPRDNFAPAVPGGLVGVAGLKTIELGWDRNTELDLRGYRVYRSEGDGAMAVLAAAIDAPAYTDKQLVSGKAYRYAVTAIDQLGNESPPRNQSRLWHHRGMATEQFYTLIAIPLLGILLNALVFLSLNSRVSSVEIRMMNLENTFTTRFDLLMGRLIELEKEIHRR
ncbi:MAG: hypothetical protein WKF37_08780 [Bryobacteraceae bacterium]